MPKTILPTVSAREILVGKDESAVKRKEYKPNKEKKLFDTQSSELEHSKSSDAIEHDAFCLSASLEDVCRPMNAHKGAVKTLLQNAAKKCFEKSVPYIFSYNENTDLGIVYDIEGFTDSLYRNLSNSEQNDIKNGVWKRYFSKAKFYAFLNENTAPIKLGTISSLKRKGICDENLLSCLLLPTDNLEKSKAMYLFLSEENLISKKFKVYENFVRKSLDMRTIAWEKEELLIDFSGSNSSMLLKKMLHQKVNPDAFSDLFGLYAVNVAKNQKQSKNLKLLLDYGANPDAEEQDPTC